MVHTVEHPSSPPSGRPASAHRECPFDTRLARTPYLVIPKMALQAMPMEWRDRLEALLVEADDAGLETPEYHVFRDDGPRGEFTRARVVNEYTGFVRLCAGRRDPWADYRHATHEKIRALCPNFISDGALGRQGNKPDNSTV